MTIEFDRRHAFHLDAEGNPHIFCPYRLDRLWRGEPDTTEPSLANLLESTNHTPPHPASATEWRPDLFTRRYLIAATRAPSWLPAPIPRPRAHRSAA